MTQPNLIVSANALQKDFGGNVVLRDVGFQLQEREILGVIGPSGSGKTTLLRCLNLLELPTGGTLRYIGQLRVVAQPADRVRVVSDVDGRPLRSADICRFRQGVGLVFQGYNLWQDRTVLDNLTLAPRRVLGEEKHVACERAAELCAQFGMTHRLRAPIATLSGGERQRVAIIRALMMHPRVLLLDEVTSALDPVLTLDVMHMIRKLRDEGMTMVVVTHHLDFASTLCDRIMYLSDGAAVQVATPVELRTNPATAEVRAFLQVLRDAR